MKSTFFKSTLILLIGGFFTKLIGLLVKITYTRIIGTDGLALYALIAPTYSLLITLANFNMQLAISKKISSGSKSKPIIINACYIMFFLNTLLILITFLLKDFISTTLLHNKDTLYPLLACSLTLPFISIGYIIKGYFYGKQKMAPHMISNVIEQSVKLIILNLVLPHLIPKGIVITVTALILINILTETTSIIVFLFFLPNHIKIKKEDLKYIKSTSQEILKITIPTISGRLIGNIGYFFEPIILTKVLLLTNNSLTYITKEYGIYNAYSISLLLFPSFFISAISNALLPEISKLHSTNNPTLVKKRINQALLGSLIVGLICTIFIYYNSSFLLDKLYKTTEGLNYIKILAPFFILFYLESPLTTTLIALNKIKTCTFISTTGIFLKLLVLAILGLLGFRIYSLIYAEIINIIYVTFLDFLFLKRALK